MGAGWSDLTSAAWTGEGSPAAWLTQGDAELQGLVGELQALLGCLQHGQQCHQLVTQPQLCCLVSQGYGQGQRSVLSTARRSSGQAHTGQGALTLL